jgi:hypothetical protein
MPICCVPCCSCRETEGHNGPADPEFRRLRADASVLERLDAHVRARARFGPFPRLHWLEVPGALRARRPSTISPRMVMTDTVVLCL